MAGIRVVPLVEAWTSPLQGPCVESFKLPASENPSHTAEEELLQRSPNVLQSPSIADVRGHVVREVEKAQTFLTSAEVDRLVADYTAGVGVLAERYGIHRATVAAHLRRRKVGSGRSGMSCQR